MSLDPEADGTKASEGMTYDAVVGIVLQYLREHVGTTQADLAKSMNLTVSTWSRIERGQSALSLNQLEKASISLGLRPNQVLKLADDLPFIMVNELNLPPESVTTEIPQRAGRVGMKLGAAVGLAAIMAPVPVLGFVIAGAIGAMASRLGGVSLPESAIRATIGKVLKSRIVQAYEEAAVSVGSVPHQSEEVESVA
jgi:transcriptional regulator with XRE-family HTH domain